MFYIRDPCAHVRGCILRACPKGQGLPDEFFLKPDFQLVSTCNIAASFFLSASTNLQKLPLKKQLASQTSG